MQNEETRPVHLHRIDATQNMRRFYMLAVQPTLFGGASIIRNWGRIGSNGQTMMEIWRRSLALHAFFNSARYPDSRASLRSVPWRH
ncbi:WGR domain-containing protein [Allorhizobium sonneratiae]|uniref:WGR domain-containing protein n=1 Tax=Allorhizobium sonneratiae TaxID=2934936 RepID=UPI003B849611